MNIYTFIKHVISNERYFVVADSEEKARLIMDCEEISQEDVNKGFLYASDYDYEGNSDTDSIELISTDIYDADEYDDLENEADVVDHYNQSAINEFNIKESLNPTFEKIFNDHRD